MEHLNLGLAGLENIEVIGRGGSSRVYSAWQVDHDRRVAVKVINVDDDPDVLKRFDRERRAMGRLSLNEGIVPIYSSGVTDGGEPYLLMPFYPEGSLADRLARGPLRWQEAVDHVTAAARTIAAAHEADVVHLDLKPANILLSDGAPRIADFGIAKLLGDHGATRTNGASFTPAYSAPETLLGDDVSPTADVYGLGATLWALIAGRPPFRVEGGDNSLMAVVGRVVHQPIDDLRHLAPGPICDVIEAAMAKTPADRPATAGAFARALAAARRAVERDSDVRPNRLGPVPHGLLPGPEERSTDPESARSAARTDLAGVRGAALLVPALDAAPGRAFAPTSGTSPVAADATTINASAPSLGFGAAVPPRFVPAVAPSGVDDALNRYGPLAAFVGAVVLLVGALAFMLNAGGDVDPTPTSLQVASRDGGADDPGGDVTPDDQTNARAPESAPIELDPAGPATVGQGQAADDAGPEVGPGAVPGSPDSPSPTTATGVDGATASAPSLEPDRAPDTPTSTTVARSSSTAANPTTTEPTRATSTVTTPRSSTTSPTEPPDPPTTDEPTDTIIDGENNPIDA